MESLTQDSAFNGECEKIQASCPAEVRGEVPKDLDSHLWELLVMTAESHPMREAVVSMWQSGSPNIELQSPQKGEKEQCLRWTYQELFNRSRSLASSLRELGCGPRMRLAAALYNGAEWTLFFWAATSIGMTFAPIDPRDAEESRHQMKSLEADVIVAQDRQGAILVDDGLESWTKTPLRIHCSDKPLKGWHILDHLCPPKEYAKMPIKNGMIKQIPDTDAIALIVFTSGTSGDAKGCLHTSRNLISQTNNYDPNEDENMVDRWLIHTPVSHIFAINNTLRAWRLGDTVVFPSKTFDVDQTLRALKDEKCTVMSATPTLVKALVSHPSFPGATDISLSIVSIAATMVHTQDIQMCRDKLGAKDAIQAYGMSEGAPLLSWSRVDEKLRNGFHPGVGKVLSGAAVRICHPKSRQVLARNQVGELHVSGASVISSYLGVADGESFYEDSFGRWLMTGDQGMMDLDGIVYILGRYKDIIIRGGENLNPRVIEEALNELPGVQAHVIGVPDSLVGELPVAIINLNNAAAKAQVRRRALELGSKYVLGEVYTFKELDINSVPITSIGKVKKSELRDIVLKYHQNRAHIEGPPLTETGDDALVRVLAHIWEDMTGIRPSVTDSITHTADSILLLRFCDAVSSSCGQRMYLQDVVKHDTIEKQAALLQFRRRQQNDRGAKPQVFQYRSGRMAPEPARFNVPMMGQNGVHDQVSTGFGVFSNPPSALREDRMLWHYAEKEPEVLGLNRSVIEEIIPIRNSLHRTVLGQRHHSYHVRMVFRVHNANIQQIVRGTERALSHHPMLRTFFLRKAESNPHHLVIKAGHQLFENLVLIHHVELEEAAQTYWERDPSESQLRSFMFRSVIISVKATGNKYLLMQYNHSIIDALSLWLWHRDLDRLIDDLNAPLSEQTPFKRFAELFNLYEDSIPAKRATLFHVKRLRGISRLTKALWPIQRAPGWMISDDTGSEHAEERRRIRMEVWNGVWDERSPTVRYPRLARVVRLPQLQTLKEYGVEASLFAKSAIFLLNVLRTGSSHAILNTWESGRSWPFVPSWIESMLPPAMSIGGPTAQWVLNLVQVLDDETVMEYFKRMASESEEVQRHQHVPWQKVVEELRDEGPLAIDASFRQSFVWDISLGLATSSGFRDDLKTLEPIARMDWADCGFFWNAFMIDPANLYFIASWDTAQMNDTEVGESCDLLADVMRKLANEENWHLKIGSIFGTRGAN